MIPSNLPAYWTTTAYGTPARWAYSIPVLVDELRQVYPTLTFLGGPGDERHAEQGGKSAHNPVVKDPKTGLGIVRAVDLGVTDGNYAPLFEIRNHIYELGKAGDPRLVRYGFMSGPDDQENNWPFGTGWNTGGGDAGHLHINVTETVWPSVPGGYIAAIDSTAPWGFLEDDDMTKDDIDQMVNGIVAGVRAAITDAVITLSNHIDAVPGAIHIPPATGGPIGPGTPVPAKSYTLTGTLTPNGDQA